MTADNALVACRRCSRRRGSRPVDAYVRELLREEADVDVAAVQQALSRLGRFSRRAHRDAAARARRRLASV